MKLQSKIIFSFFILIFLSFVGSYIATTQIWQRNLEERNNVYRERISKSISATLAMYYKSWGSFDRGWENVLVTSMTNLGLDPEKNSVGVIDSNFEKDPVRFRNGDGSMLPEFEKLLIGKKEGSHLRE